MQRGWNSSSSPFRFERGQRFSRLIICWGQACRAGCDLSHNPVTENSAKFRVTQRQAYKLIRAESHNRRIECWRQPEPCLWIPKLDRYYGHQRVLGGGRCKAEE